MFDYLDFVELLYSKFRSMLNLRAIDDFFDRLSELKELVPLRELQIQERLADLTHQSFILSVLSVFLSFIGTCLVICTYRETRKSTKAVEQSVVNAREFSELQTRPWITARGYKTSDKYAVVSKDGEMYRLVFPLSLTNQGITPSVDTSIRCTARVRGQDSELNLLQIEEDDPTYQMEVDRFSLFTREPLDREVSIQIPSEVAQSFGTQYSHLKIWILGEISYQSIVPSKSAFKTFFVIELERFSNGAEMKPTSFDGPYEVKNPIFERVR